MMLNLSNAPLSLILANLNEIDAMVVYMVPDVIVSKYTSGLHVCGEIMYRNHKHDIYTDSL